MLPVAVTKPAVVIFPPVTLAADVIVDVAEISPPVSTLPPVTLPDTLKLVGLNVPTVRVPAAVMFPDADIPVVPSKLIAISQSFILHIYN
jgi:hypothetical protein